MEALNRRMSRLEDNVKELAKKVAETLETFKIAENTKMRRLGGLNRLIRVIAEVSDLYTTTTVYTINYSYYGCYYRRTQDFCCADALYFGLK